MASKILISTLFRDDNRLQMAAVSHKYHVTIGDQGLYVRRIQYFLLGVGALQAMYAEDQANGEDAEAKIALFNAEVDSISYGDATAQAVLIYKKTNKIIGSGYQTAADNIVGVMTIRHMDKVATTGKSSSVEQRKTIAASAANTLKPAIMAGMTVGSRVIARH
ncbi:hypothetical protein G3T14_06945 [Methylobacterium sp. BTF04]|uniref:hypothetical protein n=1 Tax=Methylobacterium sp. BTF04 TaxID=2708300 RepID=UPI0013D76983|nr:hypothetical protein [Methylobacterium sp. BTF04]NEU11865.1 hypothetical protein [Methylobacterium sp. BTF04]